MMIVNPSRFGTGMFGSGFVILTTPGAGSWTAPVDFDTGNNIVELIGAGGKGGDQGSSGGGGGGGGQYAKLLNTALSGALSYQIGAASGTVGTSGSPGSADSWFDASSIAYAQGGGGGANGTAGGAAGGTGGSAAAVGSCTVRNGGNGGGIGAFGNNGGGGGGAGGPSGAGSNGQGDPGALIGGAGGNADNSAVAGPAGGNQAAGVAGNTESYWDTGKGPSTGGSGSGSTAGLVGFNGGAGGTYGGGGGGAGRANGTGGAGGQGIIVIRWGAFVADMTIAPVFGSKPTFTSDTGFYGVGDTLTAVPATTVYGHVTSGPTWQWKADGTNISGATGASYTLTSGELGKIVTVEETVGNSSGNTTAASLGTAAVPNPTYSANTRVDTSANTRVDTSANTRVTNNRIA
jgi:hypothetical protein